jgi:hypothetical protein
LLLVQLTCHAFLAIRDKPHCFAVRHTAIAVAPGCTWVPGLASKLKQAAQLQRPWHCHCCGPALAQLTCFACVPIKGQTAALFIIIIIIIIIMLPINSRTIIAADILP